MLATMMVIVIVQIVMIMILQCAIASELNDGIDNNCDGQVDEGFNSWMFDDDDGDGYIGHPIILYFRMEHIWIKHYVPI